VLGAGYMWAMIRQIQRSIPPELVAFRRQEQMQRLKKIIGLGGG
jgi:hypothetical protein